MNRINMIADIHMEPNTVGLFHPCVLVDEFTSDRPYINKGRKIADVINPGMSKGCTVCALYSFCKIAVKNKASAPTGTFT